MRKINDHVGYTVNANYFAQNALFEYDLLKQSWMWLAGNEEPSTIKYLQPIENYPTLRQQAAYGHSSTGFWIYGGYAPYSFGLLSNLILIDIIFIFNF